MAWKHLCSYEMLLTPGAVSFMELSNFGLLLQLMITFSTLWPSILCFFPLDHAVLLMVYPTDTFFLRKKIGKQPFL